MKSLPARRVLKVGRVSPGWSTKLLPSTAAAREATRSGLWAKRKGAENAERLESLPRWCSRAYPRRLPMYGAPCSAFAHDPSEPQCVAGAGHGDEGLSTCELRLLPAYLIVAAVIPHVARLAVKPR